MESQDLYSTVLYSTVQTDEIIGSVQYCTVQYSTVLYSTVQTDGMAGSVQYSTD